MSHQSRTFSTKALSTDSLSIDAKKLSLNLKTQRSSSKSSRYQYNKSSSNHHQVQRPKSASRSYTISTFSTQRNEVYGPFASNRKKSKQKQRPKTAHSKHQKSKKELLDESLHRLYPTRDELIPPKYSINEIQRAVRLERQYQKIIQKRSKFINKMNKPKFRILSKNMSCYDSKLKNSKEMLLYESPYHCMNVDYFNYRPLKKPMNKISWDLRMYNKPKPDQHFTTKSQVISLNSTKSYKKINSMINNIYRPSIKNFFGKQYDLKNGQDPKYLYQSKNHKRPIYL